MGAPLPPPAPAPFGKPAKPFYKKTWFIVLAVLLGLGAIGSAVSTPEDEEVAASSSQDRSASFSADHGPSADGASRDGQPEKRPSEGRGLPDVMSFSRSGLIEQLVYEGFSQAEAEYGVSTTGLYRPQRNEGASRPL